MGYMFYFTLRTVIATWTPTEYNSLTGSKPVKPF